MAQLVSRVEALESRVATPARDEVMRRMSDEIGRTLFDKQIAFDSDPAKRKAAFCTRRAGKTDYVPKRLFREALKHPESIRVYLAVTRIRAKELIWRHLELINERYQLNAKPNETLATWTLPNHAVIRLRGADDKRESDKGRGDKLHEVLIDEAQIFTSEVLANMVEDVYGPTLEDVGGSVQVLGTPGIVCAGKWWEMTRPDPVNREAGWSVHSWGVLDNPFMAHMKQRLPELKRERNWADDNPTYMREWLGQWVNDNSALFYRFDPLRNSHDIPEKDLLGGDWAHVLGWDIGLRDAMALVVWAFHPGKPELYEAWSWTKNGITSEEVVSQVRQLETRGFNFLGQVADTGGLGALVVEEVGKRHEMHFEAAKKSEKGAHVELFNDDLLTGRMKLRRGSPYANEIAVLPKDPEAPDTKFPVEDPRFPNHCCDAGLYAWRHALHYLHRPPPEPPPRPGSEAWAAKQVEEMEAQAEEEVRQARADRMEIEEANEWL